jgi:hypothetical protein
MDPGHLREGDWIDGDLACRVAAQADGLPNHVEGLRMSVGEIHSNPDAHREASPWVSRTTVTGIPSDAGIGL